MIADLKAREKKVVPSGQWQVHNAYFARRGFTTAAEEQARALGAQLVQLAQMEADLREGLEGRG